MFEGFGFEWLVADLGDDVCQFFRSFDVGCELLEHADCTGSWHSGVADPLGLLHEFGSCDAWDEGEQAEPGAGSGSGKSA